MKLIPRPALGLLALLGALIAPAAALATPAPGINISAYADAVPALNAGAKQVRFFVPWKNFEPGGPGDFTAQGPSSSGALTTDLKVNVDRVRDRGATPLLVILDAPDWAAAGGGTTHRHPRDPAEFAAFAGELATWLRHDGKPASVYEVWNEPDAAGFWGGTPDPDAYVGLLRGAHATIKAADPSATVLAGPTTGNNFHWIETLYARGAKGSFDGVAVHTDTACSIVGPDSFYREADGRLGQYTFLGYREVRKVMLANGDDLPIYMSEIGWATTSKVCASGESAGKKAAGVSEADQARFLTHGFRCMANDPYVVAASWFTYRDDTGNASDENHYGLLRSNGSAKPALAAFKTAGAQEAGDCGDFVPPSIRVMAPSEGQQFVDKLDLQASASDGNGVGVARITYAFDGGKSIRNFTDALRENGAVGLAPWQGSGALGLGPHTIEVVALDKNGNTSRREVKVVKVAPGAIASTLTPAFKLATKPRCSKRGGAITCSFKGSLSRNGTSRPSPGGKVAVEWQWKNKQHRFRKLVGGLKPASKPFTFTAKLRKKGAWRVRIRYAGLAPYKPVSSRWVSFKAR